MPGTCLIIGGAQCVWQDAHDALAKGGIDGIGVVNDMVCGWPYEVTFAASLHPDKFADWMHKRGMMRDRKPINALFGPKLRGQKCPPEVEQVDMHFSPDGRGGSSGLFAAKVALVDLNYDMVVLAGVPMMPGNHFDGADRWARGKHGEDTCRAFRAGWLDVPDEYRQRMRSMSGWTRILLGAYDGRKSGGQRVCD